MVGEGYSTRNAVEDIWGERTPYKHEWPTRCDAHHTDEPDKWVQSACVMCSNGCGMDIGVKNGKMVAVRGRVSDRVNHGRLGPKGLYAWKSLHHPDRLKYPMIRRHGKLERATWDEAMNLIVERTHDIQRRLTNHGIGFYTTGQLFLEEYFALALVGKAGLKTLHMDGNTRLCTATAAASMRESFGSDGQPGSYNDIDYTDCIMLVGHNMSATQTVLWSRILDRLAGPDPPTLIVIDPRTTNSAKEAHLHLAPHVGTNLALLNGIQHLLFKKNYINNAYVAEHTVGVDELKEVVGEYTPETTSRITGVAVEDIIRCADILGKSKTLLSTCLQGVYQSNQATASACQVNNINLLLGHIGKPGAGILQMNGQPTAQNNREAGCDGEYPGFRNFNNEAHMIELADLWNIDHRILPHWGQPTHIENMLKFIKQDSIEMMWISGTNPMVSLPNLPMVRELLTKENLFVVVQDIFPNETTAIADVVLPAAAWGEKTGCFTNVDRTVHLSLKAVEPPGEARPDFDIYCDFSRRMNFRDRDGKPLIPWTHPSEGFKAWKKVSKGRPCDYSGITYELLQGGSGIQWPCNEEHPFGKERLFDDGKFFTDIDYCESFTHDLETGAPLNKNQYKNLNPAGRAILKACHYVPETEPVSEEYPYHLSTGRLTRHFHTRTKTGRTKELQDADPEPFVQISEHDAKELDVKDGEIVLIESRRGKIEVPVRVGWIADKHAFIPFHYGYFDSHDGRARAANELTREQWDSVSKQPMFKSGAVRITKIPQPQLDGGEVQIHAKEPMTETVKRIEKKARRLTEGGDVHDGEPRKRFLEYWLGDTFSSIETLLDICDHVVPQMQGVDSEMNSAVRTVHRIAQSCLRKLKPITDKYNTDLTLGHETSVALKNMLFPDSIAGGLSGSPAYDCLVALEGFSLYFGHIEARAIALMPSSQAIWDPEFMDAIKYVLTQCERMKALMQHQLKTRAPQTLLVPSKHAVGWREKLEKQMKLGDEVRESKGDEDKEGE